MNFQKLYKKNIKERGKARQIDKCMEECAELIFELQKFKYDHSTCEKVTSEIADVQITIDQLKIIFGKKAYRKNFDFKTGRLARRLKKFIECKRKKKK